MILSRLVVVPFLLSSLALLACSSGGAATGSPSPAPAAPDAGGGPAETVAVDVCARTCSRKVTCDPATDKDTCISKCENADGAFLSKVSAEYAAEIATCIDNVACRNIDDGTAFRDCGAEASARLSPSATATGFCDDYATASATCGGEIAKAACFDAMKIYSDASLSDARKCLAKKCSDLAPCVAAALGSNPSSPPAPPPTTCIASPLVSAACGSCIASACCAEQTACETEPTCGSYLACIRTCTTTECLTSCGTSFPGGPAMSAALTSCAKSSCPSSCASW